MAAEVDYLWRPKVRPLCPKAQPDPDVCDCGSEHPWLMRWWSELTPCEPTYGIPGLGIVKRCDDCKRGGAGHMVVAGWEERCQRCGDVERFRMDGTLVAAVRNPDWQGSRSHDLTEQLDLLAELED